MENDELFSEKCIALTDDDGIEHHYEIIDEFSFKGIEFAALVPFDEVGEDDDDVEVILLQKEQTEDGVGYYSVEDEKLLEDVFEEFLKHMEND